MTADLRRQEHDRIAEATREGLQRPYSSCVLLVDVRCHCGQALGEVCTSPRGPLFVSLRDRRHRDEFVVDLLNFWSSGDEAPSLEVRCRRHGARPVDRSALRRKIAEAETLKRKLVLVTSQ